MNWKEIWLDIFGTMDLFGINMGFWVAMGTVTLLVVIMNIVFWSMKPKPYLKNNERNKLNN